METTNAGETVIGLVSISDRASAGTYEDKGIPALVEWCTRAITTPVRFVKRLIPDDRYAIERTLVALVDDERCDLVLTTGGTGPSRRDVTPEATLAVATRELPGFGEQMRAVSLHFVPTAILSRQVGALREIPGHAALIVNLPGQPKAIAETLGGVRGPEGEQIVPGIFAAIPYCIDLIGGPWIETDPAVCRAFRPKSALKARQERLSREAQAEAAPAAPAEPEPPQGGRPQQQPSAEALSEPPEAEGARRAFVDPAPLRVPGGRTVEITPAAEQLEVFRLDPAGGRLPAPCAIVWLGGMGTDVHDFSELPEQISELRGPLAQFYMVNAPQLELSATPGKLVRAWYDLPGRGLSDEEDEPRIRQACGRITRLVDEIAARGMPRQRIFLAGFSQGASMALFTGARQELALGGVIALSGYLPLAESLTAEIRSGGRATPFFIGHGAYDEIVPLPFAEHSARLLAQLGVNVTWREYEAEHDFGGEALADVAGFLRRVMKY
ncbi:molybdopterin adenylyltransferase [Mesosutterella sp. AGMB02718]|uniref:Molybdopterin adenylyltransferase n=1 Tax=Mesosutterella faecium TaxID=2925194 RepID=A0ABT7IMH8_9BURK|nr:molybdopterin adenylyltransferase [Mesosutterella sp. AGMB02718]MDL2058551.1 molybdopterin adenylyltransferase [Mesosutterella sp. AGMB02718]